MSLIILLSILSLSVILLIIFLLSISRKTIGTTQALIRTSPWSSERCVRTGGSAFVFPFFHTIEFIDLKAKKIVIEQIRHNSFHCKDGIRIEIRVEFKVGVNQTEKDILYVAGKSDCDETAQIKYVEEFQKSSFIGILKEVIETMDYEEVSQGGGKLREQVLHKLAGKQEVHGEKIEPIVFDGYQIYDMAVVRTEMLPLVIIDEDGNKTSPYDPQSSPDDKGITKITKSTKDEEDAKREREVQFVEREEKRKIEETTHREDGKQKRAKKEADRIQFEMGLEDGKIRHQRELEKFRKIQELQDQTDISKKKDQDQVGLLNSEDDRIKLQKKLEVKRNVQVLQDQAEISKQKLLEEMGISKIKLQKSSDISKTTNRLQDEEIKLEMELEKRKKLRGFKDEIEMLSASKDKELSKFQSEVAIVEAEKSSKHETELNDEERKKEVDSAVRERERKAAEEKGELLGTLIQIAQQEEARNTAEEKANNAGKIEKAKSEKEIEIINSEKEAQAQLATERAKAEIQANEIKLIARAKREAAEQNFISAEKDSQALAKMGIVEADVIQANVAAENTINQQRINAQIIRELIPVLPKIFESLMLPAEKIDSIKFLNINGMESLTKLQQNNGTDNVHQNSPFNSLLNTMMSVGVTLPVIMEVVKTLKDDNNHGTLYNDLINLVKDMPGGKKLIDRIEGNTTKKQIVQDNLQEKDDPE